MSVLVLILISLSLATDAFTVSIIDGLTLKPSKGKGIFIALTFGVFQAVMPLIGYLIGTLFLSYIEAYDHWVSFALLAIIGGKMIIDAIKEMRENKEGEELEEKTFSYKKVLIQGIATAIDALAIGLTIETAIVGLPVYLDIITIGLITYICCLLGVFLGNSISKLFKGKLEIAEIIGGIVLILLGLKIVLNHLGYLPF